MCNLFVYSLRTVALRLSMMTLTNGTFSALLPPPPPPFVRGIHRSPRNYYQKGQWRGALIFSCICAWTNDWVNKRDAGDLIHHRVHYDVNVMRLCSVRWPDDIHHWPDQQQIIKHMNCVIKHPAIVFTWNSRWSDCGQMSWKFIDIFRPDGGYI